MKNYKILRPTKGSATVVSVKTGKVVGRVFVDETRSIGANKCWLLEGTDGELLMRKRFNAEGSYVRYAETRDAAATSLVREADKLEAWTCEPQDTVNAPKKVPPYS